MLINDLKKYKPLDKSEQAMVDKTIEFLKTNDVVLGKGNIHGHITGSAWIVNKTRTKVLLTHHLKLNMWVQLGGHTELDETVLESARREGVEESGLEKLDLVSSDIFDVDVHLIPGKNEAPPHFHYDIRYLFECDEDQPIVSDESHDVKWIDISEIEVYTTERSVLRMVEKMER